MKKVWSTTSRAGFSSVEALLAASIFAILVTVLVGAYLYGQESTALAGHRARAAMLAEEGLEAVQNIGDSDFNALPDGTYGLAISNNQWNLSDTPDTTGIFTRTITISTADDNRKNIISTIEWEQNAQRTGSISLTSLITNWRREVIDDGNWSNPSVLSALDLSGNKDGRKVALSGDYAYVIKSGNNPNFVAVDISNPEAPAEAGSINLEGTLQDISIFGNYAYVTSSDNDAELQIVDITSPNSLNLAGSYDADRKSDGLGVFAIDNIVYMGRNDDKKADEFFVIDVSNPALPYQLGSLDVGNDVVDIWVEGNYAYVTSSGDNQELQIIDISNPSSLTVLTAVDLPDKDDALAINGFGSTAVIGQGSWLRVVDVSSPSSPNILRSFDVGGTVNDVDLNSDNKYVFVASSNKNSEFQVIDIATPTNPTLHGNLNISGNTRLFGIVYDVIKNKIYTVSDDKDQEFIVIGPGS